MLSIRDLCEKAGINRTTFYHHYGSQYDLLNDISNRFLAEIAHQLSSADAEDRDSVQERVTLVFQYLEDNLSISRLLLNSNADPSFTEKLFALPKIGDLMNASLKNCEDTRKKHAMISFAIHGSYHLLQEWINAEQRLCAVEQARIILSLARRVCTDV